MHLELAQDQEEMAGKEDGPPGCIRYAYECKVRSGRSAPLRRQLRSIVTRESGFVTALQLLVEHSNSPGLLRCDFR